MFSCKVDNSKRSKLRQDDSAELHSRYDIYGNLLEEALPNGLVTQFAYDGENNLIRQWDNADRNQEMFYDSHGNQTRVRILIDGGSVGGSSDSVHTDRNLGKRDAREEIRDVSAQRRWQIRSWRFRHTKPDRKFLHDELH